METVKPDTPEKEEDDIDIDAIWESRRWRRRRRRMMMIMMLMLFLCCGFDSRCPLQPKRLAFPLLYSPNPPPPPQPTILCFVAWLNNALYLLHINSVITRCIQLIKWSRFGILIMGVWGSFWLHIFFVFFCFGPYIFPVNKEWMFYYPPHLIVCVCVDEWRTLCFCGDQQVFIHAQEQLHLQWE